MDIGKIIDQQIVELKRLYFCPPVSHVYNPLIYARKNNDIYLSRYGRPEKEIVLIGMNPGPWGMAQTGVPFGEINSVKGWMGIEGSVETPEKEHPKRPIEGFACKRSEVSGRRLWGWAQKRYQTPERFFSKFFVANYCPLVFMEESGRNRTPDKLAKDERNALFEICDHTLRQLISYLKPTFVIGVGAFAEKRAMSALAGMDIKIGRITHPSPANPKANKGWEEYIEKEFSDMDIKIP